MSEGTGKPENKIQTHMKLTRYTRHVLGLWGGGIMTRGVENLVFAAEMGFLPSGTHMSKNLEMPVSSETPETKPEAKPEFEAVKTDPSKIIKIEPPKKSRLDRIKTKVETKKGSKKIDGAKQ